MGGGGGAVEKRDWETGRKQTRRNCIFSGEGNICRDKSERRTEFHRVSIKRVLSIGYRVSVKGVLSISYRVSIKGILSIGCGCRHHTKYCKEKCIYIVDEI
jgi:hypothetical protein